MTVFGNLNSGYTMLLSLLQLLLITLPVGSYVCGPRGECSCVQDYWVLCDQIEEVPNFRMSVRRQRAIMITIDAEGNFDTETLRLTRGFHKTILRIADMSEGYCGEIVFEYPWISCRSLETTTKTSSKTTSKDDEVTVTDDDGHTTDGEADPTSSESLSLSFEARVSFSMNTMTSDKPTEKGKEKSLLETLRSSTTLFWICIGLGSALLILCTVMSVKFLFRKRGEHQGSLAAKCCRWLCNICLCPCKCLDKIRARERPLYAHDLPVHHLGPAVMDDESVEIYTR